MTIAKDTIYTFSGTKFALGTDSVADVNFIDIAHALAHQCRFTGHLRDFYSVAQHSCYVAHLMALRGHSKHTLQVALMHDASEAYLSDIARPFKGSVGGYKEIEEKIQTLCFRAFGITQAMYDASQPDLKECDMLACFVEARDMHNGPVEEFEQYAEFKDLIDREPTLVPLVPWKAKDLFVEMAQKLEMWHV